MKFDPAFHHRRSIRLKGYDYTLPGAYFVTFVTQGHIAILGEIVSEDVILSNYGKTVMEVWQELPHHYPHVELGSFVIMPNHVHGIIILTDGICTGGSGTGGSGTGGSQTRPYTRHGLSEIVRAFKSFSARRINILRGTPGQPVWQRDYYEHIVRNQEEWETIDSYIQSNPANWQTDTEYPNQ